MATPQGCFRFAGRKSKGWLSAALYLNHLTHPSNNLTNVYNTVRISRLVLQGYLVDNIAHYHKAPPVIPSQPGTVFHHQEHTATLWSP